MLVTDCELSKWDSGVEMVRDEVRKNDIQKYKESGVRVIKDNLEVLGFFWRLMYDQVKGHT